MIEPITTPEAFIAEMRRTCFDCVDMYVMDDQWADAPPEVAEAIWEDFIATIRESVAGMFRHMGANAGTIYLAQEAAMSMVFERFNILDAMPEGGVA